MTAFEKILRLYEGYLEQARKIEPEGNPLDGVVGFGSKPSDAPCHDQFIKAMRALLNTASEDNLSSNEIRELLEYIYRAPKENRPPLAAYWMLIAVHGQTMDLIKHLNRDDARALWAEYNKIYRHWDCLPAQEKMLVALDRARKGR